MANRYNPAKKTIGELLSMTNPPILVPEWQRNFSWTTSEVETFWQDSLNFENTYQGDNILEEEYFLGSIVIVDDNVSHLLLDGQQRLATSAILISVIRDYLFRYNRDAAIRVSTRYLTDFDDAQGDFAAKLPAYRQSELLLTQGLVAYADWTDADIDNRQRQFSEVAAEIWSFPE